MTDRRTLITVLLIVTANNVGEVAADGWHDWREGCGVR